MNDHADTLRSFADAVERLAFRMPPPNDWTPQFVQLANDARAAIAALEAGRSGEAGELADSLEWLADMAKPPVAGDCVTRLNDQCKALVRRAAELLRASTAAPQQPPPVGVTDAIARGFSAAAEMFGIENIQAFARAYKAEVPGAELTVHGIAAGLAALSQQEAAPSVSPKVKCNKCMDTKQEFNWNGDGPYPCRHCYVARTGFNIK